MLLPVITTSFKPLQDLLLKKAEANLVLAALEMNICTELATYHSADEIAEILHLHPGNTAHLLDALAACDLIQKYEDLYWNSDLADEFLVKGRQTYLGDYLRSCDPWYAMSPDMICRLVREGPTAAESPGEIESGEFWEMQSRGTINYQRSGMAQILVDIISSLREYPSFSRMLDLGCGPGLYGIALVLDHPTMNGVLFDQPAVVKIAEQCAADYGVSERITVISGDYLHDPIGEGYDLILASMTLNFALGSLDHLLKKVYTALNPGGVFVTISDGRRENGTKPEDMVIPMLLPLLSGHNMAIHEDVIADAMLDSGFHTVRSRPLFTPVGEVEYTVGRRR